MDYCFKAGDAFIGGIDTNAFWPIVAELQAPVDLALADNGFDIVSGKIAAAKFLEGLAIRLFKLVVGTCQDDRVIFPVAVIKIGCADVLCSKLGS